MGSNIKIAVLVLSLVLFANMASVPTYQSKTNNQLLFSNPLILKALSGYSNGLVSDKLWLLTMSVGELQAGGDKSVDADLFYHSFENVVTLDPYFTPSVVYGTTYLASMKSRPDLAVKLLNKAQYFDRDSFPLYMLEIMLKITYYDSSELDYNNIIALANKAAMLPDGKKMLGKIKAEDWVAEILEYAHNQLAKREQALADAIWLYENTENKAKKEEIRKRIIELQTMQ